METETHNDDDDGDEKHAIVEANMIRAAKCVSDCAGIPDPAAHMTKLEAQRGALINAAEYTRDIILSGDNPESVECWAQDILARLAAAVINAQK